MRSEKGNYRRPRALLNFDVLRLICNCLTDVNDVVSFSLTCSTLTNHALLHRLGMSPIVLSDAERVEKFYSFIFADLVARAPRIYGLKLPDFRFGIQGAFQPQTVSNRLVVILEVAIHLEYLYLLSTNLPDAVFTAVANLPTLRALVVRCRYHRDPFLTLLTAIRSPLRHLHLAEYTMGDISGRILHDHLGHFAPTLETLELEHFPLSMSLSSVTTQFIATRSLKMKLLYDFNDLGVLLRLFPNLNGTLELGALSPNGTAADYPTLRERNKGAQKVYSWPSLDLVVCNAKTAFLLALECPIRRMDLSDVATWCPDEKRCLVEILRHNSPQKLCFSLAVFDGLRTLHGLFPPEAAHQLTHLVVVLSSVVERRKRHRTKHNVPWDQFIDTLIGSMKHLRLTHLRIVFRYDVYRDRLRSMSPQVPLPGAVQGHSVYVPGEENLHPVATRLFNTMPTLRYVFLTTYCYTFLHQRPGHKTRLSSSCKAWRALGANQVILHHGPSDTGGGQCVEISNEEAETVIDREELHLGSKEQAEVALCGDSLSE